MFPAHLRKTPPTLYQLAEDVFKKWTVDFIRGDQVNLRALVRTPALILTDQPKSSSRSNSNSFSSFSFSFMTRLMLGQDA